MKLESNHEVSVFRNPLARSESFRRTAGACSAVRFAHWVFDEGLPTIRKHGGYLGESLLEQTERDPEILFRFADALVKERRGKTRRWAKSC